MVERVIRVGTYLQVDQLGDGKGLTKREVDPFEGRAGQLIPPFVAEGSRGWSCKGSFVEPPVRTAVSELWIPDDIREPLEVIAAERIRVSAACHDRRKGLAALDDNRARELPTAQDFIQEQVVVQELLVSAKRQLVNHVAFEGIPDIEVRISVVRRGHKGVLDVLSSTMAAPAGRVQIVQEMRPDVAEVNHDPLAHTFLNNRLQRVVV